MTPEERELRLKERKEHIVAQNRLSREALIALCREQSPTWQEAELGNWAISKQQLSPNVVTGWEGRPKSWQEVASAITVPTLLITADVEKGAIVSPEIAEEAVQLNPSIRVVQIEGVGHNIRREACAAYLEAVKAFLAE